MEKIDMILTIVYIVAGALSTGIPAIIKYFTSRKKLKAAQSEAEKAAIKEEMQSQMKVFVQAAEIAFKDINETLKAKSSSAGPIKHDSVMLKLQNYATEKGYEFDAEYWSQQINELVAITRNVNNNEI